MESRNTTISIVKGICIILMVIGHSGCPELLHDFIYLFHMPVFFFVSGYFCKREETLTGGGRKRSGWQDSEEDKTPVCSVCTLRNGFPYS